MTHRIARLLGGLTLLAGVLLALSAPARAQAVSFTGTWKTIAGGTHQYTVILKQVGKNVTGSYSPGNGKIFEGVVSDNKLTFEWTQDGGYEGTAEFTMDQDGKNFTGSSTALKPREFTVTWNTYKPPVISFAGTWETITNAHHPLTLTMVQDGTKVTGVYPRGNGKMEGTVTGRVLRFKWQSDGGKGSGRLVMDESAQAFSGTYNKGDNPDDVENTWNGKRSAVSEGKAPEQVTLPPASFTGVWNTDLATGKQIEVSLRQTDDKVTGTYMPGSAHIKDGVVTGRVLRFQWTQENGVSGSGRFEMGADGNSFSGSLNSSKDPDAAGTPLNGIREPISFWGCWKLTGGVMDANTICLRQESRGRVTATDDADFEGMASGNTLRFTHRPAGARRSGRFIMDEGGKSFRGFWHSGDDTELNENPCTGILVPTPTK